MIRRDYIVAALEEFVAMLAKITGLAKQADWPAAREAIAQRVRRLTGVDTVELEQMSEMELLASVMQREPMLSVETKVFMLAALLKSGGDVARGEGRLEQGRRCDLKGLHLLLWILGQNNSLQPPDFAPTIEDFLAALADAVLPLETRVLLMNSYEQSAQFAKAQDALRALLDVGPPSPELLDFGASFYKRLLARSDAALEAGNLPRSEAEAGLAKLQSQPPR